MRPHFDNLVGPGSSGVGFCGRDEVRIELTQRLFPGSGTRFGRLACDSAIPPSFPLIRNRFLLGGDALSLFVFDLPTPWALLAFVARLAALKVSPLSFFSSYPPFRPSPFSLWGKLDGIRP